MIYNFYNKCKKSKHFGNSNSHCINGKMCVAGTFTGRKQNVKSTPTANNLMSKRYLNKIMFQIRENNCDISIQEFYKCNASLTSLFVCYKIQTTDKCTDTAAETLLNCTSNFLRFPVTARSIIVAITVKKHRIFLGVILKHQYF